jgi:6-pyruvoyltetrahydropterin/6-carboxytetrahydropterin synthase
MYNPAWTEEKNAEVFGLCNNPNWHGHNYELEVTVVGVPHPETGYVFDLSKLKKIVEARVLDKVDHKNLNLDVDFMRGIIPSSENFVVAIWNELRDAVAPASLYLIRLYETPRNFVEYRGELTA